MQNVGGLDRIFRGVLGTWLLVVALVAYLEKRRVVAITAVVAGAGLLFNWATGFCGANALLGFDTSAGGSCADDACGPESE